MEENREIFELGQRKRARYLAHGIWLTLQKYFLSCQEALQGRKEELDQQEDILTSRDY